MGSLISSKMIAIIDYGMGNLHSIHNALQYLGYDSNITSNPKEILAANKIILPGVGSFYEAMSKLKERNLLDLLNEVVINQKKKVLGICLGMQLFAEQGIEGGNTIGLGWIKGKIIPLNNKNLKMPHIGFNTTIICKPNSIFKDLKGNQDFYYVHSYVLACENEEDVASWTTYGSKFVSSVQKGNIFGTQFHPEKSQTTGLKVLKNFAKL
jgi:imidazole glycerol-phosphate synthase subunit HisH